MGEERGYGDWTPHKFLRDEVPSVKQTTEKYGTDMVNDMYANLVNHYLNCTNSYIA